MPQSYKTIKRAALSASFLKLFLFIGFSVAFLSTALAQTIGGKRSVQFFAHFSYRFQVPENQVESLRNYLQQKYPNSEISKASAKNEILTQIYFDDEKQTLLQQNIMLRHWVNIASENRKERIQLVFPGQKNAVVSKEVEFRHNRKPDTGDQFTSHPLLKLIRNKDRPVLDSLLKPLQIQASELKPVLEVTEHREQFYLQKYNSNWLVLTLTQIRPVNAEKPIWELQLIPDRKLLTHSTPEVKKELLQETGKLAAELQKAYPELQKQTQTEYAFMQKSLQRLPIKGISRKIIYAFGAIVLAGILIGLFRYFKQKRQAKA